MKTRAILELIVGAFMLAGIGALVVLAFKVSGLTNLGKSEYYTITAEFDNVGGLKERAPVSISGVTVGRVKSITLDPNNFRALVTLEIEKSMNTLPVDTSAGILTQGILGSNYINLAPGFEEQNMKNGSRIETTQPALILENLIGQLIYSLKGGDSSKSKTADSAPQTTAAGSAASQ